MRNIPYYLILYLLIILLAELACKSDTPVSVSNLEEINQDSLKVDSLIKEAALALSSNDTCLAATNYLVAAEVWKKAKNKVEQTSMLEDAMPLLQDCKAYSLLSKDTANYLDATHKLGETSQKLGNKKEALIHYDNGLTIINNSTTFRIIEAKLLAGKASVVADRKIAFDLYLQAAELCRLTDNPTDWTWYKRNAVFGNKVSIEKSMDVLKTALTEVWWTDSLQKDVLVGKIYMQLSYYLTDYGYYLDAQEYYEAARIIEERYPRKITSKPGANIYKPLGNTYTRFGDNEKAIHLLKIAMEKSESINNLSGYYGAVNDLATAYFDWGDYKKALEWYEKGLTHAKKETNFLNEVALFFFGKASCLLALDDIESAILFAQKGQDVLNKLEQEANVEYKIGGNNVLGEIYQNVKKYNNAHSLFNEALMLAFDKYHNPHHREIAKIQLAIANLYLEQNKLDTALTYSHQALLTVVPNFKETNTRKNPDKELFFPENTIMEALTLKGKIFYEKYKQEKTSLIEAKMAINLAIEMETQLRDAYAYESSQFKIQEESSIRHELMLAILIEQFESTKNEKLHDEFFKYIEKSKGVVLNRNLNLKATLPSSISKQERILQKRLEQKIVTRNRKLFELKNTLASEVTQIKALENEISDLKEKNNTILKKWYQKIRNYQAFKDKQQVVNLLELQNRLSASESEIVIDYFYGEEAIYAISVTKDTSIIKKWKIDHFFTTQLRGYVNTLRDVSYISNSIKSPKLFNDITEINRRVYEKLVIPMLPADNYKSIAFIPDGILNYISFDLLLTDSIVQSSNIPDYSKLPYLILQKDIRIATSINNLYDVSVDEKLVTIPYLGIAPSYAKCSLPNNVASGKEVIEKISRLYKTKPLLDEEANVSTFIQKASTANILHFYGHAKGLNDTPNYSWLALTQLVTNEKKPIALVDAPFDLRERATLSSNAAVPPETDRLIYAQDISTLELNANLVILSACETGIGKIAKGEGVISLARAFNLAGCPNIAMTLWEVNAASTATVVEDFLKNLHQGMKKSEALSMAKRTYLRDGKGNPFPSYWAGLTLIGNDSPL